MRGYSVSSKPWNRIRVRNNLQDTGTIDIGRPSFESMLDRESCSAAPDDELLANIQAKLQHLRRLEVDGDGGKQESSSDGSNSINKRPVLITREEIHQRHYRKQRCCVLMKRDRHTLCIANRD